MAKHTYFTSEQEDWLRENYHRFTSYDELTLAFNVIFDANRNKSMLQDKCTKRLGLNGMPNPSKYGNKPKEQLPVGTIRKSQTATYIKVMEVPPGACFSGYDEPYWFPLQKKIYQDAYGKIKPHQMICFLDGDRENFGLDNLYCIDRRIAAVMSVNKWWTDSREHTLTAIKWCELYYVLKEL